MMYVGSIPSTIWLATQRTSDQTAGRPGRCIFIGTSRLEQDTFLTGTYPVGPVSPPVAATRVSFKFGRPVVFRPSATGGAPVALGLRHGSVVGFC